MFLLYLKGLGTGAGLIMAIGAQNAFVLSQGVRKNHYLVVPLICALCDAGLVAIGVTGLGSMIAQNPLVSRIAGIGGAVFLFWYGALAFKSAFAGTSLDTDQAKSTSLRGVVLATLGVTLLNPHVYIDTILLMGSIAAQFDAPDHLIFGAGAITASWLWFFALSLGATQLAPLFKKRLSWRILDTFVGLIMWSIGFSVASTAMV